MHVRICIICTVCIPYCTYVRIYVYTYVRIRAVNRCCFNRLLIDCNHRQLAISILLINQQNHVIRELSSCDFVSYVGLTSRKTNNIELLSSQYAEKLISI